MSFRWCRIAAGLLLALPIRVSPAEELPALPEISPWDKTFNAKTWFGYKDNILFSHANVSESPFAGAGLDVLLWRLPENGWEFLFLGSGEYLRYLSSDRADHEAFAFGQTQLKRDFANGWKAGLTAEYMYFDQIVDVSATDREINVAGVRGNTYTLRPTLRREFGNHYFGEIEAAATRQDYLDIVDDEWQFGPALTLGRTYGQGGEVAGSYQYLQRWFDTRLARTALGLPIPGESLEFRQHEFALIWRHSWDEARHWRTVTRLSLQLNEDNGDEYYDYLRPRVSQQIRYVAKTWNARADFKLTRYDYDVQPVSVLDLSRREKTVFQTVLRAEKNLSKSVKLFAEYEYERSHSNLTVEEYDANSVLVGVDWEF